MSGWHDSLAEILGWLLLGRHTGVADPEVPPMKVLRPLWRVYAVVLVYAGHERLLSENQGGRELPAVYPTIQEAFRAWQSAKQSLGTRFEVRLITFQRKAKHQRQEPKATGA